MMENLEKITLPKRSNFTQVSNLILDIVFSGLLTKNEIQVLILINRLSMQYSDRIVWVCTSKGYIAEYTGIRACHIPSIIKILKEYGIIQTIKQKEFMAQISPDAKLVEFLNKYRLKKGVDAENFTDSKNESHQSTKSQKMQRTNGQTTQKMLRKISCCDSENESCCDSENESLSLYNTNINTIINKYYLINKGENFFLEAFNQGTPSKIMSFKRALNRLMKKIGPSELYIIALGFKFWGNNEFLFQANTNTAIIEQIALKWQKSPSFKNFVESKIREEYDAMAYFFELIKKYCDENSIKDFQWTLGHFDNVLSLIDREYFKPSMRESRDRILDLISFDEIALFTKDNKKLNLNTFVNHFIEILNKKRFEILFNNEL